MCCLTMMSGSNSMPTPPNYIIQRVPLLNQPQQNRDKVPLRVDASQTSFRNALLSMNPSGVGEDAQGPACFRGQSLLRAFGEDAAHPRVVGSRREGLSESHDGGPEFYHSGENQYSINNHDIKRTWGIAAERATTAQSSTRPPAIPHSFNFNSAHAHTANGAELRPEQIASLSTSSTRPRIVPHTSNDGRTQGGDADRGDLFPTQGSPESRRPVTSPRPTASLIGSEQGRPSDSPCVALSEAVQARVDGVPLLRLTDEFLRNDGCRMPDFDNQQDCHIKPRSGFSLNLEGVMEDLSQFREVEDSTKRRRDRPSSASVGLVHVFQSTTEAGKCVCTCMYSFLPMQGLCMFLTARQRLVCVCVSVWVRVCVRACACVSARECVCATGIKRQRQSGREG